MEERGLTRYGIAGERVRHPFCVQKLSSQSALIAHGAQRFSDKLT